VVVPISYPSQVLSADRRSSFTKRASSISRAVSTRLSRRHSEDIQSFTKGDIDRVTARMARLHSDELQPDATLNALDTHMRTCNPPLSGRSSALEDARRATASQGFTDLRAAHTCPNTGSGPSGSCSTNGSPDRTRERPSFIGALKGSTAKRDEADEESGLGPPQPCSTTSSTNLGTQIV
jgi:hypothetical protein